MLYHDNSLSYLSICYQKQQGQLEVNQLINKQLVPQETTLVTMVTY